MESINSRHAQSAEFGEACDWRAQMYPDIRQTIKRRMVEAIYKYAPYLKADESEIKRTLETFEEDLYQHAKSEQEYVQRLDTKLKQFMQLSQITGTEYPLMRSSCPTEVDSLAVKVANPQLNQQFSTSESSNRVIGCHLRTDIKQSERLKHAQRVSNESAIFKKPLNQSHYQIDFMEKKLDAPNTQKNHSLQQNVPSQQSCPDQQIQSCQGNLSSMQQPFGKHKLLPAVPQYTKFIEVQSHNVGMHETVSAPTSQTAIIDLTSVQTPFMTETAHHSPNFSQQEVKLVGAQQLGTSINNSVDAEDWKDNLVQKVETLRMYYRKPLVAIYQETLKTLQQEPAADTVAKCEHIKKLIEFIFTHLRVTRSQITPDFKQILDIVEKYIRRLVLAALRKNPSSQQKESLRSNMQGTQELHQSNPIIFHGTLYEKKDSSSAQLQNPPPNKMVLQQQVSKLNKEREKLVKMEKKNCNNPNKVLATHPPTCPFSSTTSGEDATNLISSYGSSGSLGTSDPLTPGITSVTCASGNTDGTHRGSKANYNESEAMEQPIHRLIKIVSEMSQPALSDFIEDIRSVVCANDMNFCQLPPVGPKIVNDEDLHALTNSWAKIFLTGQNASSRKRKIEFDAVPYDHISRRNANANDNSEVPLTNGYTKPSAAVGNKVNGALLQELREVNKRLIDIVVDISEEDTNHSCSVVGGAAEGKGTILKCCFIGISVNFQSVSDLPVDVGALVQPLQLLVPTSYPVSSPVFLDNMDVKFGEEHDEFTMKARAKLQLYLRSLSLPMSITDIVMSWDICVRQVIDEYAIKMGGGTFSSRHGSWTRLL